MEGNRVGKVSAFVAAAALIASAGTANAQVTAADAGCRAAIQKNAGKLGATAMKNIDGCLSKAKLAGSPAQDCSVAGADAFSGGKTTAAAGKVASGGAAKCTDELNPTLIATAYPSCPSPGDDGGNDAVDNFGELFACQVDINTDGIDSLRNYILRPDAANIVPKSQLAKCAAAIGKNATKLWSTVSKERGKCQATSDKGAGSYSYGCSSYDASSKISGAVTKLQAGIEKACGPLTGLTQADLVKLGSCDSNSVGIQGCVASAVKKNAGGATANAFEFNGVCPSSVRVVVNGGGKNGAKNTSTRLDTGWTGLGHKADVVDGFTGRVNVSCTDADCAECSVTASCAEGNCRCSNDSTISCSTPFVAGGPCGANTCYVHFGPPLPLSAGGAPTCIVNTIREAFLGQADIGTGESTTPIKNVAQVYSGISQTQPCPTCSGPAIGSAGTCNGGARNGLACTTNAVNTTFGNTSYDCPPQAGANISGSGLKIDLTLTDGAVSLAPGDACDAPLGALTCTCGGCTLDPTVACKTDADCSGAGLGTCTNAGGAPRQPNQCADLTCTNAGGEGVCNAGPQDTFCIGKLKTNGEGYITCNSDLDCDALGAGVGPCAATGVNRPCFLNPIAASGVAGQDGAELVSTFCSGPTTSGGVNAAAGTPGPGRVRLDFDFTGLCSNGSTEYELGGHNCP